MSDDLMYFVLLYVFCAPLGPHVVLLPCTSIVGILVLRCVGSSVVTSGYWIQQFSMDHIRDFALIDCDSISSQFHDFARRSGASHELLLPRL